MNFLYQDKIQQLPSHNIEIEDNKGGDNISAPAVKVNLQNEVNHLNGDDFWFSRQLVNRPCTIIGSCLGIILIQIIIVFAGGFFKLSDDSPRAFLVWSDQKVKRNDGFNLAIKDYNDELEKNQQLAERTIEQDNLETYLIYRLKKGSTLLTPQNIQTMLKVERHIISFNDKKYEELCLAKSVSDPSCAQPASIALRIAGSYEKTSVSQEEINNYLNHVTSTDQNFFQNNFLFDKNFTKQQNKVEMARSIFKFGFPFKGFKDTKDKDMKQADIFKKWNDDLFEYIENDQSTSTMEVIFFNRKIIEDYGNTQLSKDIIFSMIALGFVTIYMMIHTKSFAVGAMGSLIMGATFPISFFFYRLIFQFKFFISLHTSILFLLMGVGADDVFVFFDAWQQAGQMKELKENLLKRISYAYRRASKAMLVTSSTTVIAFLATAISKLMPIMTYGIFAAINITVNYLLVITIFPAFLVFREQFMENRRLKKQISSNKNQNNQEQLQNHESAYQIQNINNGDIGKQDNEKNDNKQQDISNEEMQQQSKTQMFFKKYWTVWTFKARYPLILLFCGLLAFKIWATLQLKTPKEPPTFISKDHFLSRALKYSRVSFSSNSEGGNSIKINLIWGISGVNQDNTDYFDPKDAGKVIYDKTFDPSSEENQNRFIQICEQLREQEYQSLISDGKNSVDCFMEIFRDYIVKKGSTFPVPQSQFIQEFSTFLNSSEGYDLKQSKNVGLLKNNRISYASIILTGREPGINGRNVLVPLFDKYENLMKKINQESPQGMKKAYQQSESWLWMVSEEALIDGAIQGIIISLSLAFIILVLSTQNFLMSLYAVITILGVVLGVLMTIWARGWEFGAFESMNSIIIIGLSVDYVVHLANQYVENEAKLRYDRTENMLTVMGVSVLGGGITTLGAGLFLFGGKLQFFQVMGTLVSSTIGFSILWSLLFYPAICHSIGAQNDQGDLKPCIKKLFRKKIRKIQKQDKIIDQK